MEVLHVYDVSNYISSGSTKKFLDGGFKLGSDGKYGEYTMPCGGVSILLDTIMTQMEETEDTIDMVFCFDRKPEYKRELFKEVLTPLGFGSYKGNRPQKSPEIIPQRDMAEEILRQMNFNVLAVDRYEADDCIASVVHHYKTSYDKIVIHSLDSDLFHLVCDNVEVAPIYINPYSGPRGKYVNIHNYEDVVNKDYQISYNCLTITKMTVGESGDGIPAIAKHMSQRIRANLRPEEFRLYGDNRLLRQRIAEATDNDKVTLTIFDLIVPVILHESLVPLYDEPIDTELLNFYAKACSCNRVPVYCKPSVLGKETIEKYLNIYNGGE